MLFLGHGRWLPSRAFLELAEVHRPVAGDGEFAGVQPELLLGPAGGLLVGPPAVAADEEDERGVAGIP